jgi:hypothetical protein
MGVVGVSVAIVACTTNDGAQRYSNVRVGTTEADLIRVMGEPDLVAAPCSWTAGAKDHVYLLDKGIWVRLTQTNPWRHAVVCLDAGGRVIDARIVLANNPRDALARVSSSSPTPDPERK